MKEEFHRKLKMSQNSLGRYVKRKTKSVSGVFNLKTEDGSFTKSDTEKAELLNNFFLAVFTKENLETLPEVTDKEVMRDLEDKFISETEVLKLLKELDASKSMGPDNINPFLLKSMAEMFVKPLTLIFQKSVSSSILQSAWKVAHQRLLKKISSYGIKGTVLSWISCFLSDRRQCMSVKGSSSTWKPVESGVPQGSVLGPILFIIYVNDIPDIVKSSVLIFADDTKIFATTDQANTLQEDLNNLMKWAELWELTFNVIKCYKL